MKNGCINGYVDARLSRPVGLRSLPEGKDQNEQVCTFWVGRSFGYMDQHMSSQVSAQVNPKEKQTNWQADEQVPVSM